MFRKGLCAIVLLAFLYRPAVAQYNMKDSVVSGFMFELSYAAQLPGGDLAKRFGFNSNIGGGAFYKTQKNWLYGIQADFIFGNVIKENGILDSIATDDGNVIANDGFYPQITYFERGFDLQLSVGKIFPWKPNPNSGFLVMVSGGYLQHHIKIEIQNGEYTPQLTGDYLNGYDRLCAGPCATEFIGYIYLGNHRLTNFFAGFEFTQGFTKSLRFDFDLQSQNTSLRYDLLNGFRVGWVLPLFKPTATAFFTH